MVGFCQSVDAVNPVGTMGRVPSAREGDFGAFRLFAHTISGGENFRVEGIFRVGEPRNGFHNCFVPSKVIFIV